MSIRLLVLIMTDHIFCIRQILEKKWEHNEAEHQLFIDLKKAYDSLENIISLNLSSSNNVIDFQHLK